MQPADNSTTRTFAIRDALPPVVDVWQAGLDRSEEEVSSYLQVLSPDEVRRADRFVFRRDRNHFIVARGILRTILARYLPLRPVDLVFSYSPLGKPALALEANGERLWFNVSHAGDFALYAVTDGRRVGIDIEQIVPERAEEGVARLVFSTHERQVLQMLSGSERVEAFFSYWTLKEAYAKALGMGLQLPLTGLTISGVPGDPARRTVHDQDGHPIEPWRLIPLRVAASYQAALAVEAPAYSVRYRYLHD